jgi:TctA family transporter
MLSDGSFMIFVSRPIAAVFLWVAIALLVFPILPWLRKRRPAVGIEEED